MRLLLDTHAFLWAFDKPEALSSTARALIENADNERWISTLALAEIAVKIHKGLLEMPVTAAFYLSQASAIGARILPVEAGHCFTLFDLPRHHGDPFDRLLIAQAKTEGLTILSIDRAFAAYGVPTIW